jgi:hypothetical protein
MPMFGGSGEIAGAVLIASPPGKLVAYFPLRRPFS